MLFVVVACLPLCVEGSGLAKNLSNEAGSPVQHLLVHCIFAVGPFFPSPDREPGLAISPRCLSVGLSPFPIAIARRIVH